ncbi:organic cation transporter protein-like [Lingula anatina]|uniref:Organic cation transporter protein-like n=1 Tax=Lingula anatina TaxID=7574 RepID=A0A1S3K958_LINAN|nr:organic cation transporter protein-like [Lingula anatina]|eukprot:XP_013419158.2 organic cation transporter protein-like [Lingula anatina]
MNFDDLLKILGDLGTYQRQRYALLCIVAVYSVTSTVGIVFYGIEPNHHCKIPSAYVDVVTSKYGNVSQEELLNLIIPLTDKGERSSCKLYTFDEWSTNSKTTWFLVNETFYYDTARGNNKNASWTAIKHKGNNNQVGPPSSSSCPEGRVYSSDQYESTIVSEFDLGCENAWQMSTCNTVFFTGKFLSVFLTGWLSDRFGRRPVFLASISIQVLSGIALAFAPNMLVFSILFVIQGASDSSAFIAMYTLGMELVGVSKRRIPAMGIGIFFGLGHIVMAFEAYFLRNWRHLALAACSPGVLFVCFWWFFPESVRWLLARGRHEEAEVIIKRIANVNKVKLEQEAVDRLFRDGEEDHRGTTYTHIELFKTWRRAFITSVLAFIWMATMMCYYGLTLNAKGLGGSLYLSFALLGAADIPGLLAAAFFIDKFGRRKMIFGTSCLGGSLCIASGLIPTSTFYLTITFATLGKMLITLSKAVFSMFLVESYPTVIRHMGLSFCSSVARLGIAITPQILTLGSVYRPLPFIVFGSVYIGAGFLMFLVPETLNNPLLQTVEEWDVVLDRNILGCTSKKNGNEAHDQGATTTSEGSEL